MSPDKRGSANGNGRRSGGAEGRGSARSAGHRGSKRGEGKRPPLDPPVELALALARAAMEKKALNVEIIDVRGKVDYADVVVAMSGRSARQVGALARHIEEVAGRDLATRCLGVEGLPHGTWVLMDFGDVIVHVFQEEARRYYDLETLWMDAARVSVD